MSNIKIARQIDENKRGVLSTLKENNMNIDDGNYLILSEALYNLYKSPKVTPITIIAQISDNLSPLVLIRKFDIVSSGTDGFILTLNVQFRQSNSNYQVVLDNYADLKSKIESVFINYKVTLADISSKINIASDNSDIDFDIVMEIKTTNQA